jgi:hypothetical protein
VLAIVLAIVGVIILVSGLFIRIRPGQTHIGWVDNPLSEDMHKKCWVFFGIIDLLHNLPITLSF